MDISHFGFNQLTIYTKRYAFNSLKGRGMKNEKKNNTQLHKNHKAKSVHLVYIPIEIL